MAIILLPKATKIVDRELRLYPIDETGGVLFGMKIWKIWIVHAISPSGQRSIRSSYSFSMNDEEKNQNALKIVNGSFLPVKVLGIWHKHNHDFSPCFSAADVETNYAYAQINAFGAISVLASKKGLGYFFRGFKIGQDGKYSKEKIYLLKYLR